MGTKISLSSNFFVILLLSLVKYSEETKLAPALYVFGDSTVDPGNNPFLVKNVTVDAEKIMWNYGMDHPLKHAIRFCNGRTVPDFLAEKLGLHYQPAALNPNISLGETLEGLNYGSMSAGILNDTGKDVVPLRANIYFGDQVKLFKRTVEQQLPKLLKSKAAVENHLTKSIFFITIGSNDYILNYEFKPEIKRRLSPDAFAKLLVNLFTDQIKKMYRLGARKFVISEGAGLGCLPDVLLKTNTTDLCNAKINKDVLLFNKKLQHKLQKMSRKYEDATFVTLKSFDVTLDLVYGYKHYGFVDPRKPCMDQKGTPCQDRDAHVFYDPAHPTQAANKIVANRCFSGQGICVPLNVQQLAMKD